MGLPERIEIRPDGCNPDRRYFTEETLFVKWDSNVERGLHEAAMLKSVWGKFSSFPYFVSSKDVGNGYHELIMNNIPGETLEKQTLTAGAYRDVCAQLFRLASALLEVGVVHGDINVSNLIYHNGRLSLIDWEMARPLEAGQELYDMIAPPWGIVKTINMLKVAA